MKKIEFIKKYGKERYEEILKQTRDWNEMHKEEIIDWRETHRREQNKQQNQKDGKYYKKNLIKNRTGLRRERADVRCKHGKFYRPYKKIIDPEGLTQLHHQWMSKTPKYQGVALVEKDQHMHGFIDVIQILEGEITLFIEQTG